MNKIEKKYLAPNSITAANMFLGYLSIFNSIKGNHVQAAWFIVIAMICDGLDGQAARKLEAYSEFGKEFDSFCDAISFGLAPALFFYTLFSGQPEYAQVIVPISFIYALSGVVRLVKFNVVTIASDEKDDFSGMPIPNGASMIISYFLFSHYAFGKLVHVELFQMLIVIAAFLMVSTIPFKTPDKTFRFIPKKLGIPAAILVLITIQYSMFIVTYGYVIINLIEFYQEKYFDNEDVDGDIEEGIKEDDIDEEIKESIRDEEKDVEK